MSVSDVSGIARQLLNDLDLESDLRPEFDDDPTSALQDWVATGLQATGSQPFLKSSIGRGRPATVARAAACALAAVARTRFGTQLAIDGADVLGRRAQLNPALRTAITSQITRGGSARLLKAADSWWVLGLARPSDLELVPALVETEGGDSWASVERWSAGRTASEAVGRALLLGMPAARLGETPVPRTPWQVTSSFALHPTTSRRVVNLGSLWAAPLAAHLLGRLGFEVIHVEAAGRPDGSQWSSPGFYAELRADAEVRKIDFSTHAGRAGLHKLVSSADIVIEASRPRALEGLGVSPSDVMDDGRGRTWLQITGHGPDQPHRVGFGDDASVAGGLVVIGSDGIPGFYGDAVADPLAGLLGALAVAAAHDSNRMTIVQTSLARSAAYCLRAGDVET